MGFACLFHSLYCNSTLRFVSLQPKVSGWDILCMSALFLYCCCLTTSGELLLCCILSSVDLGRAKAYGSNEILCLTHCSRALSLYVSAQPQGKSLKPFPQWQNITLHCLCCKTFPMSLCVGKRSVACCLNVHVRICVNCSRGVTEDLCAKTIHLSSKLIWT